MQLLSSSYLAGSMPLRDQAYLSDESAEQLQALGLIGVQGECEGRCKEQASRARRAG